MSCKQGDLAIYTRTNHAVNRRFLGSVVRCVAPAIHPRTKEDGWVIEPSLGGWSAIADRCLRPIRPGDITTDEVRDLYMPKLLEAMQGLVAVPVEQWAELKWARDLTVGEAMAIQAYKVADAMLIVRQS